MGTGHYQKGKPRYSAHPFVWDAWRGLPQGDLRVGGGAGQRQAFCGPEFWGRPAWLVWPGLAW